MSNPAVRPYLDPYFQLFINRLISLIIRILRINGASVPMCVEPATNILDALQDWLPLDAGHGFLHIETQGSGSLNITIRDSTITISFVAKLPFNLLMEPITVFTLSEEGSALANDEKVEFLLLLLRRATWGWYGHNPNVKVESEWTWDTDLRPSPKWIALRERAKRTDTLPPRAIHWMPSAIQSGTGA